jgi:hypothetical protein
VIGAKRITAPDGTTWQVGRRWLPRKQTLWRRRKKGGPGNSGLFDDPAVTLQPDGLTALLFVLFVLFLLLTVVVFPLLIIAVELVIVVGALVAGLGGRVFLRKPWTIRARATDGRELTWHAPGFRRSGRVRNDAAAALALGQTGVHPSEALEPTRL